MTLIKSARMRWTALVGCMRGMRNVYKILAIKLAWKILVCVPRYGLKGIILQWALQKQDVKM